MSVGGVPLAIVDQNKLQLLIDKLFEAQDADAIFDMDISAPASNGDRTIVVKVKASVSASFADVLLKNQSFMSRSPHYRPQPSAAPNATPPSTTPPPKKKEGKQT